MMTRFAPSVVLVDDHSGLTAGEIEEAAAALQRQVVEHLAPAWNLVATVRSAAGHSRPPDDDEIQIRLLDRPTLDNALGYHDRTDSGQPIAYVFVGLCREYGMSWTSVASHEILELLCDPYLHLCVQFDDGTIWDREVADRVEADSYLVDGVEVSNFNFPACFEPPTNREDVRYDFLGSSTYPNEIRPGGYAQRFDPDRGWVQIGMMRPYRLKLKELGLSRRARKTTAVFTRAVTKQFDVGGEA